MGVRRRKRVIHPAIQIGRDDHHGDWLTLYYNTHISPKGWVRTDIWVRTPRYGRRTWGLKKRFLEGPGYVPPRPSLWRRLRSILVKAK